jgi:hypothetical protein
VAHSLYDQLTTEHPANRAGYVAGQHLGLRMALDVICAEWAAQAEAAIVRRSRPSSAARRGTTRVRRRMGAPGCGSRRRGVPERATINPPRRGHAMTNGEDDYIERAYYSRNAKLASVFDLYRQNNRAWAEERLANYALEVVYEKGAPSIAIVLSRGGPAEGIEANVDADGFVYDAHFAVHSGSRSKTEPDVSGLGFVAVHPVLPNARWH